MVIGVPGLPYTAEFPFGMGTWVYRRCRPPPEKLVIKPFKSKAKVTSHYLQWFDNFVTRQEKPRHELVKFGKTLSGTICPYIRVVKS